MGCPDVSGMVVNILTVLNDENAVIYPSGKVNIIIFKDLNGLNGLMGTAFSGNAGEACIYPSISGTAYQAILELMVALNLTKSTMIGASRISNVLTVKEGDSSVTMGDTVKNLQMLYKHLTDEFNRMVAATKYTIASANPSAVHGGDSGIQEIIPYNGYAVYRPYGP